MTVVFDRIGGFDPSLFSREARTLYNRERVRSYLEDHLGCSRKEVVTQLQLCPKTVAAAVKAIRAESKK